MPIFNKSTFLKDYETRLRSSILSYKRIENPTERDKKNSYPDAHRIFNEMLHEYNLKIHSEELLGEVYDKADEIEIRLIQLLEPAN